MFTMFIGLVYTVILCTLRVARSEWSYYVEVYPNKSSTIDTEHGKHSPLYFGLMLSLSGDQQSTGALAGVQAALDHINSRDDLLPGYSLQYTLTDSKCNRTIALDGLFKQLFQPPQEKVALIGSGCSTATEATAEVSKYFNITQLSCASSSDELSDRVRFPYYFQLLPSEFNLARVFYSIIKEYGWRKVALIVQNEERYKATMNYLMEISQQSVTYSEVFFADGIELEKQLSRNLILDSNLRVYIFAMNVGPARLLICEVHRLGMKYPRYVFITYGSYDLNWWAEKRSDSCNAEDMAQVLQFSLAVLQYNAPFTENKFYASCHDATWTLAYALNNTLNGSKIPLNIMMKYLENTDFLGISGPVNFNENGVRQIREMIVLQYRTSYTNETPIFDNQSVMTSNSIALSERLKLVKIAYMGNEDRSLHFLAGDKSKIWPGLIPLDGVPKQTIVSLFLPVTISLSLLNICGITFGVVCLVFNIVFRTKRLIRLDSPNLNYAIISGSIMIYIGCILLVTPTVSASTLPRLCIVRASLVAVGYSLAFGTVITKLWRIYLIFRLTDKAPKNTKKVKGIKDWHLMLIVLGFIVVDVIHLIIYIVLEGVLTNFSAGTETNEERPSEVKGELRIQTNFMVYTCSTNPWIRRIALGLVHFYKGLLQLSALFFAFKTRKVKIKGLNNTKYITALVYATSIIITITGISLLTLMRYINVYAFMYCFSFWLATSLLLGLSFVPKMVSLYKDPDGDTVFTAHNHALEIQTTTMSQRDADHVDVDALKQRIKTLEEKLIKQTEVAKVDEPKATSVSQNGCKRNSWSHLHEPTRGDQ